MPHCAAQGGGVLEQAGPCPSEHDGWGVVWAGCALAAEVVASAGLACANWYVGWHAWLAVASCPMRAPAAQRMHASLPCWMLGASALHKQLPPLWPACRDCIPMPYGA